MTDDDNVKEPDHKGLAIATFNATWDLMDKELRTAEENDMMVHTAHASRYHWGQVGGPTEFERGDWQLSRVYALLGKPDEALHYAKHCLNTCQENGIGDFDLAFAYEAMARAYAIKENWTKVDRYTELAKEAAENIEDQGNRDYFLGELDRVPRMP
jgi:tetratricopeptide (TPR) repeat protein